MSDPLRTDGPRAHDAESGLDRDAKIEQLLLVGLDHYFAASYELAINVWTRALFLDRSHARARAYIERARSALAERQRASEELLQNGVAAFQRGDGDEARRLLQAAIDGGAPSEEALAVLERINRVDAASLRANTPRRDVAIPHGATRTTRRSAYRPGRIATLVAIGGAITGAALYAASRDGVDWRALVALAGIRGSAPAPAGPAPVPVTRDAALPLPRRGETALIRARALMASGRLHDALATLDAMRATDPQKEDADRLRADIQRQLLALTPLPVGTAGDGGKPDRRVP